MKNIKYILLALIAVFFGSNVNAQSLRIFKKDGSFINVPYAELDSIVAVEDHEFVDLGLSVKWATCNVGAEKPEDFGYYVAWGETFEKENYDSESSITMGMKLNDISGIPEFDVAAEHWGGTARMPTSDEYWELHNKCRQIRFPVFRDSWYAAGLPSASEDIPRSPGTSAAPDCRSPSLLYPTDSRTPG